MSAIQIDKIWADEPHVVHLHHTLQRIAQNWPHMIVLYFEFRRLRGQDCSVTGYLPCLSFAAQRATQDLDRLYSEKEPFLRLKVDTREVIVIKKREGLPVKLQLKL